MKFEHWMKEVDDLCLLEYGLSIHDLPDMCFWDAYASDQSPEEFMAEEIPDMEALARIVLS